jgi:uncharacterized protein YbjQ (UPF0145 family)
MLAVTIDNLPGFEIKHVIGEVIGMAVRSQNPFVEGIRRVSGEPNSKMPEMLRRWRTQAISHMVEQAYERGANAVVGVRFDQRVIGSYTEICAYGTAVFIVPGPP